jgi:hypothetical protein
MTTGEEIMDALLTRDERLARDPRVAGVESFGNSLRIRLKPGWCFGFGYIGVHTDTYGPNQEPFIQICGCIPCQTPPRLHKRMGL